MRSILPTIVNSPALVELWRLVQPRRWKILSSFIFMVINRLCAFVLPICTRHVVNDVMLAHKHHLLPYLLATIGVSTAIQALSSAFLASSLFVEGQKLVSELRAQVRAHISHLPLSFYDESRTGNLMSRIMGDVEGVRNLIGTGMFEFVGSVITSLCAVVLLAKISVRMTYFVVVILILFAIIIRGIFRALGPLLLQRAQISEELTGRLGESLAGIRTIKGYQAEEREQLTFVRTLETLLINHVASTKVQYALTLASTAVVGTTTLLTMSMAVSEQSRGKLSIGDYIEYTMLLAFLISPIVQLVSVGTLFSEAMAGLKRTAELFKITTEGNEPTRIHSPQHVHGHVSFENVSFSYHDGPSILRNISFEAMPGTITALVGSSGSGKSTIVNLCCSFYKASSGRILLDGYDVEDIKLETYRRQLGLVLQETFLFDGTIRENVAFSKPDATIDEVTRACEAAEVDEFVQRLPMRYDTVVGERGMRLSGGQRQRVAIARALLCNPRILILDEATSSLDSESEALVQQGLAKLVDGRTTLVIAHRLSTIRRATQILVVEDGEIVERGTHETLLRSGGRYFRLYTQQHQLQDDLLA